MSQEKVVHSAFELLKQRKERCVEYPEVNTARQNVNLTEHWNRNVDTIKIVWNIFVERGMQMCEIFDKSWKS